jgi:hypothetical protein
MSVSKDVALWRHVEIIALMMEAGNAFETYVSFDQSSRRNIPEDSHLHTRRRGNLKSH